MEREEFKFSNLQPVLSVMFLIAAGFYFSDRNNLFMLTHNWFELIIILFLVGYMLKNLSISVFALQGKPAVILTDKTITITAKGDTIYWTDVVNVYMSANFVGLVNRVKFQFISIRLREPEKYIKSIKNPIIRNYRWYTRNWRESSSEVSLFLVKGDGDEIYHEVLRYYQNNRGF